VPLGYLIAFRLEKGLPGLWFGMMFGLILLSFYFQYLISFKYDWLELSKESLDRSMKDIEKLESKESSNSKRKTAVTSFDMVL
jgi:hypothetical protein